MAQQLSSKNRLPIHGVLLLDKPVSFSSNDALIKAKRMLNARKAGHTGTLDPFATGLLPLCFGEATKFAQDLLDATKTYEAIVHLGVTTDTGDTEGSITKQREVQVSIAQIEAAVTKFRGEIEQIPPMYSALKHQGKPLYEYARAGLVLERKGRIVNIHALDVLDYQLPYLTIRVTCSKGTYIRVLGQDIGDALGCGAHLQALRRTHVGTLSVDNAITVDELAATSEANRLALLAPVDALLDSLPAIDLPEGLAMRFLQGQRLSLGKENLHFDGRRGRVRVYRKNGQQLLGTAQLMEFGLLAPERLIAADGL